MTDRFPFAPGTVFWVAATDRDDAEERARNLVGTDSVTYLAALHDVERSAMARSPDGDATEPETDEADDEDEAGSLAPDETDGESDDVSASESGAVPDRKVAVEWSSFGLESEGKPSPEPGSCYHALLTVVQRLVESRHDPMTNSDCKGAYGALGFDGKAVSAVMATLRDKYELVAPVEGWPPAYVPTYRGKQYLDEHGLMSVSPEDIEDEFADLFDG